MYQNIFVDKKENIKLQMPTRQKMKTTLKVEGCQYFCKSFLQKYPLMEGSL